MVNFIIAVWLFSIMEIRCKAQQKQDLRGANATQTFALQIFSERKRLHSLTII
jgi:hypothetical protein